MSTAEERLESLHQHIRLDTDCPLFQIRGEAVPGEGPAHARVFFLGEAPGKKELETGRPLVGNAGRAFNELLDSIGLKREDVYLTGAIKCRPPDNRTPKAPELNHCRGFLWEALEIIQPEVVCPMGTVALKLLLGNKASISRLHGQSVEHDGRLYFPLYHPAAWFYNEGLKPVMQEDFRRLGQLLLEKGILAAPLGVGR